MLELDAEYSQAPGLLFVLDHSLHLILPSMLHALLPFLAPAAACARTDLLVLPYRLAMRKLCYQMPRVAVEGI